MSEVNRRTFLRRGVYAGGALAMQGLVARGALDALGAAGAEASGGYGPLQPAKSRNTGETLLALPEGFEYTVLGRTGSAMSDGRPTPRAHDGMAAFRVGGELRLVRNHEINSGVGTPGAALAEKSYDPLAGGGTTTLVIDPKTRELVRSFVSLSGTLINCAGGPTPWGSWISCEETVMGPTRFRNAEGRELGGFERPHGYCFEVSAASDGAVAPEPLRAMGRFVHEAVAVDPRTKIVYETEDRGSAGFYRFLPNRPGRLAAGGRLQMLAVKEQSGYDTRRGQTDGAVLPVAWVDIERPDPPEAEQDWDAVYKQGLARGGATFARLEGCWYGAGRVYFTSTNGGDKQLGQVWEYEPRGRDGGNLRLLYESASADSLRMPDNLCVSPRHADCLVICEDGDGVNHVRCLTPRGQVFDLARNIVPGFEKREFAGATFSPDGQTLFVNIQVPGITFAIWGPWRKGLA
ncbi:MAG TPA: alkaline phosphatase PhoX [Pyrinomonadaceae bacterium]|nr:alkaline phosphatase PhoX [Pyrinomonadaceae bacterium]